MIGGTHLNRGHISKVPWLVMLQLFRQSEFDSLISPRFGDNLCCRINWASRISLHLNSSLTNTTSSEMKLPKIAKLSKYFASWNTGWQLSLLKTKPCENHCCSVSELWSYQHTAWTAGVTKTRTIIKSLCRGWGWGRKTFCRHCLSK